MVSYKDRVYQFLMRLHKQGMTDGDIYEEELFNLLNENEESGVFNECGGLFFKQEKPENEMMMRKYLTCKIAKYYLKRRRAVGDVVIKDEDGEEHILYGVDLDDLILGMVVRFDDGTEIDICNDE